MTARITGRLGSWFLGPLEHAMWLCAKKLGGSRAVAGLDFVDFRAHDDPTDADDLEKTLAEAMKIVHVAGANFTKLVTQQLHGIARMRIPRPRANTRLRVYQSPFSGRERKDARLLAAHLVWTARYFELMGSSRATAIDPDHPAYRQAQQTQLWFVKQLPDWESWLNDLRPIHPR